jgi:hypothetical protein
MLSEKGDQKIRDWQERTCKECHYDAHDICLVCNIRRHSCIADEYDMCFECDKPMRPRDMP